MQTTSASPITVITVVEVVGASPSGQTSSGFPVSITTSAEAARGLSVMLVKTIVGSLGYNFFANCTNSVISRVLPEFGLKTKHHVPELCQDLHVGHHWDAEKLMVFLWN